MATVLIDKLLQAAIKQGVSDIHIVVGQPPVFRLHGRMRKLETKTLEAEDTVALMKSITPERCQRELQEAGSTDFGFAFGDMARFRVSVFKQRGFISMVLRQIPNDKLTPEQLGLPEAVVKLVHRPRGLFLVTGPTGSGKSTTLASLINLLNETVDHHIITIEDPIEFYHDHIESTINQREVGVDVPSFSEAIRRALRQDPDVILVGELRDLETIEAAISAAETGHVVFGTLHTNSAQGTVNRIIDAFPGNLQDQIRTQLASTLIGVVAQTLLPKIGGGRCGGLRSVGRHAGCREPDSRKQDVPHQQCDANRCQVRHAVDGRRAVQPLEGRTGHGRRRVGQSAPPRRPGQTDRPVRHGHDDEPIPDLEKSRKSVGQVSGSGRFLTRLPTPDYRILQLKTDT